MDMLKDTGNKVTLHVPTFMRCSCKNEKNERKQNLVSCLFVCVSLLVSVFVLVTE